ncbi:di-N-acetylchitobiase-like isoform X1 [Stegostoma tigrinum]|uniref:di-N-acetylchitobiase-like isoform X1 n=1 Tax=Stegostoma tigrinum TaxID=3053191 RepID=UPI002870381B|nr:di-N-acetylchitobiase-like isoform X1 [Stegostoma tigrinum]
MAVLALEIRLGSTIPSIGFCPCSSLKLCNQLPENHQYQVEAVVFDNTGPEWKHYDWSKITTIVVTRDHPSELLCHAHANGVRVVWKADVQLKILADLSQQSNWINQNVNLINDLFLDGVHLDIMGHVSHVHELLKFVAQVKDIFRQRIPGSQVSVSIPWTPVCPDGKCYDYASMAQSCDFLYVKAHDIRSDVRDECFAKANAPYDETLSGLSEYIRLGVDSKKLILGLLWYGYDYPCDHLSEPGRCKLKVFPFESVSCSSPVVEQVEYKQIMQMLPRSITGRYWDDNYKSPYFVYKDKDVYHEVWYDDPESLSLKSSIVKKLKLGGIGAWFGNSLNYSANPTAAMQTEDMWNALCPIRLKWRT